MRSRRTLRCVALKIFCKRCVEKCTIGLALWLGAWYNGFTERGEGGGG